MASNSLGLLGRLRYTTTPSSSRRTLSARRRARGAPAKARSRYRIAESERAAAASIVRACADAVQSRARRRSRWMDSWTPPHAAFLPPTGGLLRPLLVVQTPEAERAPRARGSTAERDQSRSPDPTYATGARRQRLPAGRSTGHMRLLLLPSRAAASALARRGARLGARAVPWANARTVWLAGRPRGEHVVRPQPPHGVVGARLELHAACSRQGSRSAATVTDRGTSNNAVIGSSKWL